MSKKTEDRRQKVEVRGWKQSIVVFSAFFLLFFISCQDIQKPKKPDNLISKEKMSKIMLDLYLTNAARSINNKLLKKTGVQFDSLLYAKYQIDSLQFAESNAYYSANLKEYEDIVKVVKDSLTILKKEKDSIYKIIKKKREDSIFKINKIKPSKKKQVKKK